MLTDLATGIRAAIRQPVVSGAVILAVSLATALTCALFSVLDGLLFRPLPFREPASLISIEFARKAGIPPEIAYARHLADRRIELKHTLEQSLDLAAQAGSSLFFSAGKIQELRLVVTGVGPNFFRLLGVQPAVGRDFTDADAEQATPLAQQSTIPLPVILGHGAWKRLFAGDPQIIGLQELAGRVVNVVGVMPPGVKFPDETDVWAPVPSSRAQIPSYGRLRPGQTISQLSTRFPELHFRQLRDAIRPVGAQAVASLFAGATLLLLVAWVQVAALIFAATLSRLQEIGVRLALGASRRRITRQFTVESAVLIVPATVLSWMFLVPLTRAMVSWLPVEVTRGQYLDPDVRTFAFGCLLSALGLLSLAVLPLQLIRRAAPQRLLCGYSASSGLRFGRVRQIMLTVQVTFTAVLLYLAGLATHSFSNAVSFDFGFDASNVLTFSPPSTLRPGASHREFDAHQAEQDNKLIQTVEGLRRIPQVTAVERVRASPLRRYGPHTEEVLYVGGQPLPHPLGIWTLGVGPDFVAAAGARLVSGESFGSDRDQVLVNETLARRLAPSPSPIGKDVRANVLGLELRLNTRERYKIAGVIRDLVQVSPSKLPEPQLFYQMHTGGLILVQATPPVEESFPAIEATLQRTWGQVSGNHVRFLRDDLRDVIAPFRAQSLLLGLIAALSIPLAAIGLVGALIYLVNVRIREIAIRIALGASDAAIRRDVVRAGLTPVAVGVIGGTLLGVAAGKFVESTLLNVQALDPLTVLGVAGVFLILAHFATAIAARRACGIEPTAALRQV